MRKYTHFVRLVRYGNGLRWQLCSWPTRRKEDGVLVAGNVNGFPSQAAALDDARRMVAENYPKARVFYPQARDEEGSC
jgi:hypothetical protein